MYVWGANVAALYQKVSRVMTSQLARKSNVFIAISTQYELDRVHSARAVFLHIYLTCPTLVITYIVGLSHPIPTKYRVANRWC